MADIRGGSFTRRTSTRKTVEALRPPASLTSILTDIVPDLSAGGKTDSQRFVPAPVITTPPKMNEPSEKVDVEENLS